MTTDAAVVTDPISAKPPLWMAPIRALWPAVISIALAIALIVFILPRINGYQQDRLANCGIAIILAVSLTVVNGFTGQFSIGHSGFMALGGYAAASLMYYGTFHWFGDFGFHGGSLSWTGPSTGFTGSLLAKGDWLFLISLLFGSIVAAAVGWIVGLPSLRLRGDYLAIVTLGFCEIVRVIIQSTPDQMDADSSDPALADLSFPKQLTHLGGALGFSGTPTYGTVFWIAIAAMLTIALTIRLKYSGYGRAMLSIREDDIAAQAVGVNITKLKVRAFVFSAFFAGLAGGLFAIRNGTINAGELGFQRSFDFVIMVVLGGLGSISGAAIAAILLTLLPEWLRDPPGLLPYGWIVPAVIAGLILLLAPRKRGPLLTLVGICIGWETMRFIARYFGIELSDYRLVIYALLLIVTMIIRPQGLFGVHEMWDYLPKQWQWWNRPVKADG